MIHQITLRTSIRWGMIRWAFAVGCVLVALLSTPFAGVSAAEIRVTASHPQAKGPIGVIVYSSKEAFDEDEESDAFWVMATGESSTFTFDLASGEHSVLLFLDQDNNSDISTNFIGIPKEPLGVLAEFDGRPTWEKSKFLVADTPLTFEVVIENIF